MRRILSLTCAAAIVALLAACQLPAPGRNGWAPRCGRRPRCLAANISVSRPQASWRAALVADCVLISRGSALATLSREDPHNLRAPPAPSSGGQNISKKENRNAVTDGSAAAYSLVGTASIDRIVEKAME